MFLLKGGLTAEKFGWEIINLSLNSPGSVQNANQDSESAFQYAIII